MVYLLIPILFSVWAAIFILLLLYKTFKPTHLLRTLTWLDQSYDDLTHQASGWSWIFLCDLLGWFLSTRIGQFLWMLFSMMLSIVFCGPIVFYAFFRSVYNFGPVRRSLWEILVDPVPPEEYYVNESNETSGTFKARQMMNRKNLRRLRIERKRIIARPVPRKVLRNKRIRVEEAQPLLIFQRCQHDLSGNCGFKTSKITPVADKHNVHSSYSSPHASTMGLGSMDATVDMGNIFDYAIYSISVPKLFFLSAPKKPPDGIISDVIMFMTISSIFLMITSRACLRLSRRIALRNT